MFSKSSALLLISMCFSVSALAGKNPSWDIKDPACPAPSETNRYINVPLFHDLEKVAAIQNIPGLNTHKAFRESIPGREMRIFYELMAPFDPNKKTVIFIPGGPGQDHTFLHRLMPLFDKHSNLSSKFNIIAMDHRGVGCSRNLSPGSEPHQSLLMRYAASDIELIRKELLGENGKIFVWGGSYGTMLAQTYALLYPNNIERLILWGAFSEPRHFTEAQSAFIPAVLAHIPQLDAEFPEFQKQYPKEADLFMRAAAGQWYSFMGRDLLILNSFKLLKKALENNDPKGVNDIIGSVGFGVMEWMMRSIACTEIFDWRGLSQQSFQLFPELGRYCQEYQGQEEYFNYTPLLGSIQIPTYIHAGKYDHVTTLKAQEEMHSLMPGSYLYVDQHSGHGIDKPKCFAQITLGFLTGTHQEIDAISKSESCTKAPVLPVKPVGQ